MRLRFSFSVAALDDPFRPGGPTLDPVRRPNLEIGLGAPFWTRTPRKLGSQARRVVVAQERRELFGAAIGVVVKACGGALDRHIKRF